MEVYCAVDDKGDDDGTFFRNSSLLCIHDKGMPHRQFG
jgi:hypothetical protein